MRRCWLAAAVLAGLVATPAAADTGPIAALGAAVPQGGTRAEAIRRTLAGVTLPPGFRIDLYALVPGARAIAVGPQGTAALVSTRGTRVYALTGQGSAPDAVREFAPGAGFSDPHGVCFASDGTLFVAELNRVLSFAGAEAAAAGRAPAVTATTVVGEGALIPPAEESGNHGARVCRVGPDGRLYVALGQPYNVPPPDKQALYRQWGIGGIVRMNRDGSGREVFARGIRNSVGLDFAADGTLWFTDNQVDGMGDDIPPGEINRAERPGQDFGFPWYGGGHVRTVPYRTQTPPPGLVFPVVEEVAHAADLGMAFYSGAAFPPEYRGAIFSAQHGSWNRSVPVGARVMVTRMAPDGTPQQSQPFAEGWLGPDGDYSGRPVDVAMLRDGSLLVSDDQSGAVYRITYEGKR